VGNGPLTRHQGGGCVVHAEVVHRHVGARWPMLSYTLPRPKVWASRECAVSRHVCGLLRLRFHPCPACSCQDAEGGKRRPRAFSSARLGQLARQLHLPHARHANRDVVFSCWPTMWQWVLSMAPHINYVNVVGTTPRYSDVFIPSLRARSTHRGENSIQASNCAHGRRLMTSCRDFA
jgi:hypothetical protein